jgi:hypothetical protein
MPHLRRITRAAIVCAASLAQPALAETVEDEQAWINLTAMGSITDRAAYFVEIQPRFGDGISRVDQLLLRAAVGWKLSPAVTLYQGYGHIVVPVEGGRDLNEERSFQQLSLAMGKPLGGELSSRTRLEQRWRSNGRDMGWRLRSMVRFEKPLRAASDNVQALVWAEPFVALNDTDWGARAGFDQLRSFAGVELGLPGASTAEIGYLNQIVDQRGGDRRMNHVASFTVFFRP